MQFEYGNIYKKCLLKLVHGWTNNQIAFIHKNERESFIKELEGFLPFEYNQKKSSLWKVNDLLLNTSLKSIKKFEEAIYWETFDRSWNIGHIFNQYIYTAYRLSTMYPNSVLLIDGSIINRISKYHKTPISFDSLNNPIIDWVETITNNPEINWNDIVTCILLQSLPNKKIYIDESTVYLVDVFYEHNLGWCLGADFANWGGTLIPQIRDILQKKLYTPIKPDNYIAIITRKNGRQIVNLQEGIKRLNKNGFIVDIIEEPRGKDIINTLKYRNYISVWGAPLTEGFFLIPGSKVFCLGAGCGWWEIMERVYKQCDIHYYNYICIESDKELWGGIDLKANKNIIAPWKEVILDLFK